MTTLDAGTAAAEPNEPLVDLVPEARRVTGVARAGVVLTYAASAATAWNGAKFAGLRPGDLLLFLALGTFFVADLGRRIPKLPTWVWTFAAIIVFVTVLHEVAPTDPLYLAQRLVVDPRGVRIPEVESNLKVGLKFVVPIVALPLMFAFAYLHDRRAIFRCAYAFAVGSAISGLIGFSDGLGLTRISVVITGLPAIGGRAPGLAVHPNFLATTCVLSLPIVLWRLAEPAIRSQLVALVVLLPLVLGIYASGSRGGAAVTAGAVALSFALMPGYRRILPAVTFGVAISASLVFVVRPVVGDKLLQAVRLEGNTGSASGSDMIRSAVGHQGILDFQHSPIDGVGLQVAAEAHNVYIQALASGGLLLFFGYVMFVVTGIVRGGMHTKRDPLAYPLFVAAVAGAALSLVENALTDRLAYVPLALIAALVSGDASPFRTPPVQVVRGSVAGPDSLTRDRS